MSEEVVGDARGGKLYVSTPYTRGIAMRERKETVLGVNLGVRGGPHEPDSISNPGDDRNPDIPVTTTGSGPVDG